MPPAHAPSPGHTPTAVLHGGGLQGPSGTKGLMVRPHSPPPQGASQQGRLGVLPAFPETAGDTPFLAEANIISVTKKEHSGGGGELTVRKGVQHRVPRGLTLPCPVLSPPMQAGRWDRTGDPPEKPVHGEDSRTSPAPPRLNPKTDSVLHQGLKDTIIQKAPVQLVPSTCSQQRPSCNCYRLRRLHVVQKGDWPPAARALRWAGAWLCPSL